MLVSPRKLLDSATETARPTDWRTALRTTRVALGGTRAGMIAGRMLATLRFAPVFTEPLRFALGEMGGRVRVRSYLLRNSPVRVYLRHCTADANVVGELFVERVYEPPVQVLDRLRALERPPRILDLGANIGLFGAQALARWPGAQITAVEPDPSNLEIHRLTVAANPAARWHLKGAAAATETGQVPFAVGRFNASAVIEGHEPGSEHARMVPAIDVLPLMADADFIKMDIEGSEWALLNDPRFAALRPAALVIEHHAHLCPGADPQAAARESIAAAGYDMHEVRLPPGACPGQGMLWAWPNDS
jgi:FkbM family methyltransferase